jgi:hypothetical protein
MSSPAALFATIARDGPSQDRISYDFHSLPGDLAIDYGQHVAVYDNQDSADKFGWLYPDWTTKVEKGCPNV